MRGEQQAANTIVREQPGVRSKPALRIDNDARRLRPRDPPHRQLGIVGDGGADTDYNDVHQGPQPVQMHKSPGPVDVFRMAGFSRNPAVK